LLPERSGVGFDDSNHLPQHRGEDVDASDEGTPRARKATFFILRGGRSGRALDPCVEVLLDLGHGDRAIGQAVVRQNADGAPAEHAQEAKDHFALLVVAVGKTLVIAVAVHGMTRVNGTGRTIAAEAGLSNLHNAGGQSHLGWQGKRVNRERRD